MPARVTDPANEVTSRVDPPSPPDPALALLRTELERTRRWLVFAVVAIVVVAIVGLIALGAVAFNAVDESGGVVGGWL